MEQYGPHEQLGLRVLRTFHSGRVLTVTEALEAVRDKLGLQTAKKELLLQAIREELGMGPPAAGESFKQQVAKVCEDERCEVETGWAAVRPTFSRTRTYPSRTASRAPQREISCCCGVRVHARVC